MEKEKKINTINKVQVIEPDSVRIGIKENAIQLEFGQIEHIDEEQDTLNVLSNVRLSPKYLQYFMIKIVEAGIEYEKNFNVDIGFAPFWKPDKK